MDDAGGGLDIQDDELEKRAHPVGPDDQDAIVVPAQHGQRVPQCMQDVSIIDAVLPGTLRDVHHVVNISCQSTFGARVVSASGDNAVEFARPEAHLWVAVVARLWIKHRGARKILVDLTTQGLRSAGRGDPAVLIVSPRKKRRKSSCFSAASGGVP